MNVIKHEMLEEMRAKVAELFRTDQVKLVIGFEAGSLPGRSSPVFIRRIEDVPRLHWDSFCANNLATYLRSYRAMMDQGAKVGIIAKGCDTRALNVLMGENQLERDKLVIIGVPCQGMLDLRKIAAAVAPEEIEAIAEQPEQIRVQTHGQEHNLPREELLYEHCRLCRQPEPVISDFKLSGTARTVPPDLDEYAQVKQMETRSPEERWSYFTAQAQKCIRCYACRNACPMCYCENCFVDHTRPRWLGSTLQLEDLQMYQITRAFHLAGRCVACGNCIISCPQNIDLGFLLKKLEKDVEEFFHYKAGLEAGQRPALDTSDITDPNTGVLEV